MPEPTNFDWEEPITTTLNHINEYLQTYQPHSQKLQRLIYGELYDLTKIVEREVRNAYRERDNASAQESTRENMKLISHILSGDIAFHHNGEEEL